MSKFNAPTITEFLLSKGCEPAKASGISSFIAAAARSGGLESVIDKQSASSDFAFYEATLLEAGKVKYKVTYVSRFTDDMKLNRHVLFEDPTGASSYSVNSTEKPNEVDAVVAPARVITKKPVAEPVVEPVVVVEEIVVAPVEEAPVEEAPVEEAPVEEAPVEVEEPVAVETEAATEVVLEAAPVEAEAETPVVDEVEAEAVEATEEKKPAKGKKGNK